MRTLVLISCLACPLVSAAQDDTAQDDAVQDDAEDPSAFSAVAFGDAFYMADWNRPAQNSGPSDVSHRAFDYANGFGLAFAGADLGYATDLFGVTIDLRLGEGASRLIDNDDPVFSILKQAFVSYMPREGVRIDFGQFDTIYGAEVADSWRNLNYTRGALYYLMQPFYHTGLRGSVQVGDTLGLTAMLVNGTNNPIDGNLSPHIGLQATYAPRDSVHVVVGYYTGAGSSGFGDATDPTRDDDWEHLVDLVFNANVGPVTLVANADLYVSGPDSGANSGRSMYWGAMAAIGVHVVEEFRFALRGEILQDPDAYIGDGQNWLATGTLTLEVRPVANVIIRLDNRLEYADAPIFTNSDGPGESKMWFSSTLGVVVTSDP